MEIPVSTREHDPAGIIAFANARMGELVKLAPTTIIASSEPNREIVDWHSTGQPNPIATCSRKNFRHILARIASVYMDEQHYCGFSMKELRFGPDAAMCFLYLGNCGDTGFWVRMSSRRPTPNS